jgi:hypothetical protein
MVLSGAAAFALITWRANESRVPEFTETREFGLWVLLLSIQVASWPFFLALLLSRLSLTREAMSIRAGHGVISRRLWLRAIVFSIVVVTVLFVVMQVGLALGFGSGSPLWGHVGKSTLITVVGVGAALPAMLSASILRDLAQEPQCWPDVSVDVDLRWVEFLRRHFRSVLGVLSIEIAFVVLVSGALNQALAAVETGNLDESLVLAFGGLFTVVVVAGYLYGTVGINHRARELLDQWTPLPGRPSTPNEAASMKAAIEHRNTLGIELGLNETLREGLGTTLLVGLPLLSSFLSEVIGREVI